MGPLVDTSVLIDYFGGARTREADVLDRCLAEGLAPAVAPVIVQEFMQGFSRPRDVARAQRYLEDFERVPAPGYETHEHAAALHRDLKRAGRTTPTVDSLIVAIAREYDRVLLTRDDHQRRLAAHCDVELL
jgi:predicted nucleic acid-binding protein